MKDLRLSTQIALVTFLALALLAGSLLLLQYKFSRDELSKQAEFGVQQAASMVETSIVDRVIYGQLYALWSQLHQLQELYQRDALLNLRAFAVVNARQEVLSHSDPSAHPLKSRLTMDAPGVRWLDAERLQVVEVIHHPNSGRDLGRLQLIFDVPGMDRRLSELQAQLSWSMLAALLLAVVVAMWVHARLSRPLRMLTREAEKVGSGEVEIAGFSHGTKEICHLAEVLQQADRQLRRSRVEVEQLAEVVRQASELVILTDPNGVIQYVNPAFERVSGYRAAEAIGQTPRIVKSGEHSANYYAEMWQTLKCGKSWHDDFKNRRKDGSIYEVEQSIFPLFGEQGVVVGFAAVQRDVTEQRGIEKKLHHADRVESLGVLAGGIAHDFNNLLTAILGNTGLALKKLDDLSPARRHVEAIEMASQSAADLCRQMLAYSGKGRFVVQPINLTELVEGMGKLIAVSIPKAVSMRYELADQMPLIDADIAQMQQVVLNLITNAAEAIGEDGGIITLSTGRMRIDEQYLNGVIGNEHMRPGDYACLEVSDTGCGMTEEVQRRIFDPFFTTKFSGRGLGMSAMLGIVRGHKGGMRIYSEPGEGTSIKIAFPISASADVEKTEPQRDEVAPVAVGAALVIDDEPHIREVAAAMLEEIGFSEVLQANDGVDGVELYRQHGERIRLVLLDMTMPRMNGKVCFTELRKLDPDVCVILSSGYNEQDATSRFAGKGLAGFIQKPYTPDALAEKVREALHPGESA